MSAFSDLKEKTLTMYYAKAPGEQKMILALLLCFVVFVTHSLYSSVSNGLEQTANKLKKQQELNQWASEQIAIIKQSGSGDTSASSSQSSMTQVINNSARKFKISIERLQPQKDDLIKVGLAEVEFNSLLKWLAELSNRYGVHIVNIDISKADTSGVVKVRRLDLGRG